jgi:hypothetical protein
VRIRARLLGVIPAIDLDHEPLSGCQEIRDESAEQRYLPAKHHPEPPAANASPEQRF